jgi:hypothetical protein
MILSKILGFLVKKWLYLVMLLAIGVYGYIRRSPLSQPDPASGHVFRVVSPGGRRTARHVLYLTSTERSLYYGSFIVIAAGTLGMIGQALIRNRNRTTTSG